MRSASASSHLSISRETACARLDERRRRLRHARCEPAGLASSSSAVAIDAAPARVGAIAERDDADAVLGQPSHLRAEARQAAAVRDDVPENAGLGDAEPEAVAAGVQLRRAVRRSRDRRRRAAARSAASRAATRAGAAPVSGPSRGGQAAR